MLLTLRKGRIWTTDGDKNLKGGCSKVLTSCLPILELYQIKYRVEIFAFLLQIPTYINSLAENRIIKMCLGEDFAAPSSREDALAQPASVDHRHYSIGGQIAEAEIFP